MKEKWERSSRASRSALFAIFGLSALARIVFAFQSVFAEDERAIYETAARFYSTGKPAVTGARVVYTGTVLPGMLQDLLAGGPLFLSGGWPWITVVTIAIAQAGAVYLLWDAYRRLFPKIPDAPLAVFLAFAPWTFMYSGFINTSYLMPLSLLVFWGWVRWLQGEPRAAAAVSLGLFGAIQFNLAATFLFAWTGITLLVFAIHNTKRRKALLAGLRPALAGTLVGGLPLVPYFYVQLTEQSASAPLNRNLHFDWNHVQDLYKVFFRYLSFPTGETTRFLGMHRGFAGAVEKMHESAFLMAIGVPTLLASVALTVIGFRFFVRRAFWREELRLHWDLREAIGFGPLLMMLLFMFSIKEPSAHTLLPILALSFYPLLTEWPLAWAGWKKWILPVLSILGLVFSTYGYWVSYRPSLLTVQQATRCVLQRGREACGDQIAQADPRNVDLLLRFVR